MTTKKIRKSPDERKREIMNAALKLFKSKGYENVRLQDILDDLGLSKGGFYHHFKSVRELLREIIKEHVQETLQQLKKCSESGTALEGLVALFATGSAHQNKEQTVLDSIEGTEGRTLYLEILRQEFDGPLGQIVRNNLQRGIEAGEYDPIDIDSAVEVFTAINSWADRHEILGNWSTEKGYAYAVFSIGLMSEALGLGDQLVNSFTSL